MQGSQFKRVSQISEEEELVSCENDSAVRDACAVIHIGLSPIASLYAIDIFVHRENVCELKTFAFLREYCGWLIAESSTNTGREFV